jgi:hypothetical protein
MTGLFLLAIVGIWFYITIKIIRFITGNLPEIWWRPVVGVGLFVLILPLPLVDEIVGGRQFEQLCKENSTIHVDRVSAAGKTVYLAELPDTQIDGAWVPIRKQPWTFVDVTTGETIISYNIFYATGGRLIRTLGISEGNVPLTFKGSCAPTGDDRANVFIFNAINEINRPEKTIGEIK